ncbi:YggS family pyridoxal phosphate-dependent enzyme [Lutibaculum baratangense]|nr:YggS family pyridoxal phosphate-dependent enzyme [Lutibaculum baratangense]
MTDDQRDEATPAGLDEVRARIRAAEEEAGREPGSVTLVAVSKTFEAPDIRPVLQAGQRVFGENRVQEAMGKWPELREEFPDIELQLIGPLQTNKAKEAVTLFDVISSVDREKLAGSLAKEIEKQGRAPRLRVQVNIGEEPQKAGIPPAETEEFVRRCREEHGLEIEGLMCIPPFDEAPAPFFALLAKLADRLDLPVRSMGMSGDFEIAVAHGATEVRVGSAIFGGRPPLKSD